MDTNFYYSQAAAAEQSTLSKLKQYIKRTWLSMSIIVMGVIIAIMVYTILGQLIQINVRTITVQETVAKSRAVEEELFALQNEVNRAKSFDVISYKASQEYGMIRRDEKKAVTLSSQSYFTSKLVYEEPLKEYESFSFVEAVKSILK